MLLVAAASLLYRSSTLRRPACDGAAMDDVLSWSGRLYPAAALVIVGAGLVVTGLGGLVRERRRRRTWPEWAMAYLFTFRRVVVGLCTLGAGVGWAEQVAWLLAVCICIGIGELIESSYYIGVLRWAPPE
jgi:hypothetical protein